MGVRAKTGIGRFNKDRTAGKRRRKINLEHAAYHDGNVEHVVAFVLRVANLYRQQRNAHQAVVVARRNGVAQRRPRARNFERLLHAGGSGAFR